MERFNRSIVLALSALTLAGGAWAQRYKVVELPLKRDLGPLGYVNSAALNSRGRVAVSEYWLDDTPQGGELCSPMRCERMPLLPDHGKEPWSSARDINDAGEVVGSSSDHGVPHAVLLRDGVLTQLGPLADGKKLQSHAYGINNRGEVVGTGEIVAEKGWRGFHWKDGVMTILPTLGGSYGRATAINDAGVIVGTAKKANDHEHAFMLKDGTMTDLGALDGRASAAAAINAQDDVAGYFYPTHAQFPIAFVYRSGAMSSLGTLPGDGASWALGINDAGDVVGTSVRNLTGSHVRKGFLHDADGMRDLNDLLRASDRKLYTIEMAFDINSQGDIAARASRKDDDAHVAVILRRID